MPAEATPSISSQRVPLPSGSGTSTANAMPMSAVTMSAVTRYHLSGDNTRVVFINGDDDAMKLEYAGRTFQGRELYRQNVAFGFVVSAIWETIPDQHTVWLTLAVPEANCPQSARSIPITTFAVFTTMRTSIAGPAEIEGQLRSYKTISLEGNAW